MIDVATAAEGLQVQVIIDEITHLFGRSFTTDEEYMVLIYCGGGTFETLHTYILSYIAPQNQL